LTQVFGFYTLAVGYGERTEELEEELGIGRGEGVEVGRKSMIVEGSREGKIPSGCFL
jgi:hypothetical protein